MERIIFDQLNRIYGPLAEQARELTRALRKAGVPASWGWYALHSVKIDGSYETEQFPIPVVTAGECCDVGFNLDHSFLELRLSREKALTMDWERLPAEAEVYGAEEYLSDFYHPGMELGQVTHRIEASGEVTVCVAVEFPAGTAAEALAQAVCRGVAWAGKEEGRHGTTG